MLNKASMDMQRRAFVKSGAAGVAAGLTTSAWEPSSIADAADAPPAINPFITPDAEFKEVVRIPKPTTLSSEEIVEAGLTKDTWQLEITADPFVEYPHTKLPAVIENARTITDGNALNMERLLELGKEHEVHFFKAMQCLNIQNPLGQGLWSGVPLRIVLKEVGKLQNVRRIFYWGYHYHDPQKMYKASVSYTQCMESPPGELPVFLAYRLNGKPISLERGGPVRLVVPWSHGYKSVKWLQHIFLTNDARNHDSYAHGNNDPDSFLKSAAYVAQGPAEIPAGQTVRLSGQVIAGPSGVKRVEYWVRKIDDTSKPLDDDSPELLKGPWIPCDLAPQPDWSSILPEGVDPKRLHGFDPTTGQPMTWPPKYCMCQYTAVIRDLKPGKYEVRARSVDFNDFAQPEPRPNQKNGKNALQLRRFQIKEAQS
jgi:DMSO/TMAO reductase YedYZ molybdopterin-dependent catalytic subunit